jgi:hypothetical protein
MRRILAIALLIAFGSPFVLPLLASTADSQAGLPACCRRNGAHHCSGMTLAATGGPAAHALPCRFFPSRSTVPSQSAPFTVVPALAGEPLHALIPLAPGQRLAHTSVPSSNLQRGPPALLA